MPLRRARLTLHLYTRMRQYGHRRRNVYGERIDLVIPNGFGTLVRDCVENACDGDGDGDGDYRYEMAHDRIRDNNVVPRHSA